MYSYNLVYMLLCHGRLLKLHPEYSCLSVGDTMTFIIELFSAKILGSFFLKKLKSLAASFV